MRKVYEFDSSSLFYCNEDEYREFITYNDCWCTSFLLCAKNPFHKDIVGYDKNCSKDHPEYLYAYRPDKHIMALNMVDADDSKYFSDEMIDKGIQFIDDELKRGNDVIVVCNYGESRSPSMCLMYLMAHGDISIDADFRTVVVDYLEIAPEWYPNKGIGDYCEKFWNKIRKEHNEN